MNYREHVTNLIHLERQAQDAKWGEQNHLLNVWMLILVEEAGETAQAILKWKFEGGGSVAQVLREAVQTVAVAVQMLQCIQRDDNPTLSVADVVDEVPETSFDLTAFSLNSGFYFGNLVAEIGCLGDIERVTPSTREFVEGTLYLIVERGCRLLTALLKVEQEGDGE
jgi:NTP pyrophosphatase (non-canonical NTP hydrolase)